RVGAGAAVNGVVATAAFDAVVPGAAVDGVSRVGADDGVVATPAVDRLAWSRAAAVDRVVAGSAGHGRVVLRYACTDLAVRQRVRRRRDDSGHRDGQSAGSQCRPHSVMRKVHGIPFLW